jgi:hypothetical protein
VYAKTTITRMKPKNHWRSECIGKHTNILMVLMILIDTNKDQKKEVLYYLLL